MSKQVYPGVGIMIHPDKEVTPITGVEVDGEKVTVHTPSGEQDFTVIELLQDDVARTVRFRQRGDDVPHIIRPVRSSDGLWLSRLHTRLPEDALVDLITDAQERGDTAVDENENEAIYALAVDGTAYLIGLLYVSGEGSYIRDGGAWVLSDPDGALLGRDDLALIELDPSRADEFVRMYDRNYVPVSIADQFQSATSESELSEPSDE